MVVTKDINRKKYVNAILYFLQNCNNNYLGATKLNKLMYYLDFVSYRDREKSVTGDRYLHLDYGPVPDGLEDLLVELKQTNKISIIQKPYRDKHKTEFAALENTNPDVFDDYEQALLEKISNVFELWSTDKIVSQTHLESPWFYSKPYDPVDYEYSHDIDIIPTDALPASSSTS